MNNHTTYALLVNSEEKGRGRLEIAVYLMCIVSAILAISQFAWQPSPSSIDELSLGSHANLRVSHQQAGG
ncbi:MAG: hypothetical protein DME76_20210 [Verrucomicrobia bacterium]|nr:MAG: hypothetical protein DME76_20210 [Verrucomicrobiota bacterium]